MPIIRYGQRTGNDQLVALGVAIRNLKGGRIRVEDTPQMNRLLYSIFDPIPQVAPPQMPEYMEMPNLQVFARRKGGLYAAIKGGHNGESHNHNDIGTFIIYADGQPMVVDMGNKLYTAKTFGPERYTLDNTRSMNHNVPLIGNVEQQEGREYHAQVVTANEHGAELILTNAYPAQANVCMFSRTFSLQEDGVKLHDHIELSSAQDITWVFMLRKEPVCEAGKVTFGALVLHHDLALTQTVTEIPVTDVRLKKEFPRQSVATGAEGFPCRFF